MTPPQVQQHQGEDAQPPQQQSNNMQLAILPADHNNNNSNNSNNSNKKQQQPLNPIAMMKRSDSGFVGLSNQGATCYLNSLVQALYMTPELRKLVYQWRYNPNVHASPEHCIPLQLQRLFARLQLSEKRAAMTKDLTKSFGWNQSDSFIQHDIQELCRVLMDALDESFEQSEKTSAAAAAATTTTTAEESSTTVVECNNSSKSEEGNNNLKYGRVSDLYKGIMLDYIQVVEPIHHDDSRENDQDGDVPMGDAPVTIDQYKPVLNPQTGKPYGRVREDVYMDIQLVVRDMNSIEESLTAYMKPELLTGDNRWSCEELNDQKVDAKKGLALKTLPYLLSLQLNRFDFDYVTWERIKLANKISFPFYLDMTSFVPPSTDNHTKLYELFAVLIHSGSANGGHYFAYIKSFENGKWYNFNDSSVQEIEQEAVKIMYGGTDGEAGKSLYKNVNASTNAYMLMYRMIDPSKNVVTVPDSLIAEDIRREIEQENELFRAEVKQKEREQEIAKVKVFLPKAKGDYSKIVSFDIELEKNATFEQAKKQIFAKAIEQEEWSERESQIEHARIREYDFLKRCPGKIVRASDDTIISSLGIKNYTSLTIQTKYPDEDWPVETAVMNILLSPLNPETKAFDHLLSKSVRADQTLRELKQELSKILGEKYPAESLNVVTSPGDTVYNQYNAKDEDKRIDAELGMKNNDIVYVEVIEDENTPSLIIDKLLEMENMINIYFNKPETSFMYDQLVEVDKRGTILDVKKKISEIIGVPCDQFRLCHKVSKLPLTNEQLPIKDSKDVFDYCQLYVEIGDSLKQDEILLNVSLFEYLDPNMISEIEKQIPQIPQAEAATEGAIGPMTEEQATVSTVSTNSDSDKAVQDVSSGKAGPEEKKKAEDEAQKEQMENLMKIVLIRKGQFRDLGKLIVREDMTVSELKQLIKETYFMDDIYLDSTLMRVRVRQLLSLGKIFKNDSATLKEAFPELTSGKSIVVQKLTHPEKFAENDMIVYVQRWLPSQWEFTHGSMRKFEVVINREHTKNAQVLKQTIYDAVKTELFPETLQPNSEFNVQAHLGVSKAPTNFEIWYKKECAEVALLNWNSLLDRKTKEPLPNVFGPPLCTVEDDLFIIRDMREPEKFDLDELKSKVSSGSGERALTIKVYNKKDEEEEKRRKEEEEQKQKEQQQQAEPANGKEDRNEQPLSKKQKTTSPDT